MVTYIVCLVAIFSDAPLENNKHNKKLLGGPIFKRRRYMTCVGSCNL